MNIDVVVKNKIAAAPIDAEIVCGNSDYTLTFAFDEEWNAVEKKTARFAWIKNGESKHRDVAFTGNVVAVPVLAGIMHVYVGVYAGDLQTTTPAQIKCRQSILCGDTTAEEVPPDIWAQLQEENKKQDEQIKQLQQITSAGAKELPYSWEELAAKVRAGDFTGINVGDYIVDNMNSTQGETLLPVKCYVMGIDTYYGVGNAGDKVPHHIDFVTFDIVAPDKMNATDTNNGTAAETNPWRASYAYNAINFGKDCVAPVTCRKADKFIIEKIAQVNSRYSASGSVNNQTGWKANVFSSLGKYWLPTEAEVFGNPIYGESGHALAGGGWNVQYPLFRNSLQLFCTAADDRAFWLCTPKANNDTAFCAIKSNGNESTFTAAYSKTMYYPICFRIG